MIQEASQDVLYCVVPVRALPMQLQLNCEMNVRATLKAVSACVCSLPTLVPKLAVAAVMHSMEGLSPLSLSLSLIK